MQQPQPMFPVMPSFPQTNITTEQIQKYLDENKKLILAILDNQNLGKLAECAQYQAQLQKNLMYLAAIADAQPQGPAMAPQMAPNQAMQQGGFYIQHPQAAAMAQQQQQGMQLHQKMALQFNNPHQLQDHHQQHQLHQQAIQSQMNVRPGGVHNGMHHTVHGEPNIGGGGGTVVGPHTNKPDTPEGADGQGDAGKSSYKKDEAK